MKENKPCRDAQGRYYWPKIYVMDDNDAKAVSSIDHEDETTQNLVHLAELSTSNKSPNTKIAALPRTSRVFSKELDDSPHPSS
jgi:hypothetical protein